MEHAMRQMQLFAVIGAPPGLSNEHVLRCSERELLDNFDQSTLCSSRCRSSSPFSVESHHESVVSYDSIVADVSEEVPRGICTGSLTTVTIRNLVGCTRQMLLDFLNQNGFRGRYDLVYLPLYFRNKKCFPFAFINFLSESIARDFQKCANGCTDAAMFGDKVADVSWSECQGLQANIENYRNSSIMHPSVEEEFKPLLFKGGRVVPFPKPTREINAYRKLRKPKRPLTEK
jgi:hypothetical protein